MMERLREGDASVAEIDKLLDVTKQIEKNVDSLLEALNVASQSDLRRVNRKLSKIDKKLRELEKSSSGSQATRAS